MVIRSRVAAVAHPRTCPSPVAGVAHLTTPPSPVAAAVLPSLCHRADPARRPAECRARADRSPHLAECRARADRARRPAGCRGPAGRARHPAGSPRLAGHSADCRGLAGRTRRPGDAGLSGAEHATGRDAEHPAARTQHPRRRHPGHPGRRHPRHAARRHPRHAARRHPRHAARRHPRHAARRCDGPSPERRPRAADPRPPTTPRSAPRRPQGPPGAPPGVPPADATRYTSAFSGSLPPAGAARPPRPLRPRPVDPPTEIIKPVEDDYDDDYEDEYDDYEDDDFEDDEPPPPPPDSAARKTVRTVGELLITLGLVILLFVVYEVYITDLISAGKQDDATSALDDKWGANTVQGADPQRQAQYDLVEGEAFAKMYIPAFGPDYKFSIIEGTSDKHLEIGPGHYVNTALPGAPGNFAVAGHRVGKGAPFNDLDLLRACDAIIVETKTEWFVYRMLPKASEVAGWAQSDRVKDPKCGKVSPLGAPYDKTVGQEIVLPTQGEVIDPVPHFEGEVPQAQQVALLTLTTCHPRFSDKQRLIVHAVLTQGYPKAEGFVPEEFKEQ
ncbi:class E sortase [Actinosynnema sp. CA-248983]